MGGAGAGNGASGRAEDNGTTGTHEDLPSYRDGRQATSQKFQELTGISEPGANESMRAILGFTQERSVDIRNLQYGDTQDMTPKEIARAQKEVEAINRYIEKMPKFKGEVYRGKDFTSKEAAEAFINKLKKNDYEMPAISSFSSAKSTAEKFAKMRTKTTGNKERVPVVMVVKANKSGASIRSLSEVSGENEVLVPKNAKYKLNGKPYQKDGIWYVPLTEK